MANAALAFVPAMDGDAPVIAAIPAAAEYLNSTTSSSQSTITVPDGGRFIASVTAVNGNIWVRFGANPTAAVGSQWLIISGQTREFGYLQPGWRMAIIDA